jgi:mannose-6-phosphate isomerase
MLADPSAAADVPYPLLLEPVVLEKVWGGRRLAGLGKRLPDAAAKYGESWELADMDATSASGAGGGAVRSVIAAGALKGRTVREAMERWGDGLLERPRRTKTGAYPLLIKFLDAGEHLSVQVHPSPAYAAANAGAHLKTECWYVLDAAPGAVIYKGLRAGVTKADLERAARRGDDSIVGLLEAVPAVVGECHNLPSGTVHALGAGVLVAEVQTPSDTTFRLYDWGRAGRALHVVEALECAECGPPPAAVRLGDAASGGTVETAYFTLSRREVGRGGVDLRTLAGRAVVVLEGAGVIEGPWGEGTAAERVERGRTVLVPSGLGAGWTLRAETGLVLLVAEPKVVAGG